MKNLIAQGSQPVGRRWNRPQDSKFRARKLLQQGRDFCLLKFGIIGKVRNTMSDLGSARSNQIVKDPR